MAQDPVSTKTPDLTQGVALTEIEVAGRLLGHVGDDEVLVVRGASGLFAVSAYCTHYHGPLVDGLVVDDTVRCPWHHACFDLQTGAALCAPAFDPLARWAVEQREDRVFVRERLSQPGPRLGVAGTAPQKIVIVGGGAAGF